MNEKLYTYNELVNSGLDRAPDYIEERCEFDPYCDLDKGDMVFWNGKKKVVVIKKVGKKYQKTHTFNYGV